MLPGGKALKTEGLRKASSVGQEVGIKVRLVRLDYKPRNSKGEQQLKYNLSIITIELYVASDKDIHFM